MGLNRQLANLPDAITTDTSNNVGIGGSPSGTYKFEVTGYGRFNNSSAMALQVNGGTFTQATSSSYSLGIGNTGGYDLTLGTSSTAGVIQTWSSKPLSLNPQGNNVLIGSTTDSSYKLDVTGAVRFSSTLLVSGAATFSSSVTNNGLIFTSNASLFNTNSTISLNTNDFLYLTGSSSGGAVITSSSTRSNFIAVRESNIIDLWTSGTERMRITSGGQVTINAPTSGVGLLSNGRANEWTIQATASSTSGQSFGLKVQGGTTTGDTAFLVQNQSGSTDYFKVRGDGNVGIGITSPSGLLSLKAEPTNTPTLVFQNSLGGPNSAISNFTSSVQTFTIIGTNYYVNSSANGARFNTSYAGCGIIFDEGILRFATSTTSTNPSTRMTITADGALQVSKNTLNDSVQMFSNVSFGSGTTGQITINQSNSWYVEKQSDGYYWVMYGMDSAGLGWKWNTYSGSYANRFFFHANGTAYNSTGTWGNSSDIRLKQDIVDANPQWDDIKALKFKKYRLKKDVQAESESTDGYVAPVHFGLIAQEVELTSPGLIEDVIEGDSTTKMIKTSIMLMKSVKALQEAMIKIEELNDRINKLENK